MLLFPSNNVQTDWAHFLWDLTAYITPTKVYGRSDFKKFTYKTNMHSNQMKADKSTNFLLFSIFSSIKQY